MTLVEHRTLYPDYIYHYPCFKKVQIAAVKRQIFHPNLPTLRAMDRDSKGFSIWSRYMDNPELFADRPEDRLLHKRNYDPKELHFNGHRVTPQVATYRNIRMTLKAEPRLEQLGQQLQQQPTASGIKSRYRHETPVFFRDMSSKMWYDPSPRPQHPVPPAVRTF